MATGSIVKLTVHFTDEDLEEEEQDEEAERLLAELNEMEEVEFVDRVPDLNLPEGSQSLGQVLVGVLMAEVNVADAPKVMALLGDRLEGKPMELEIEANGKSLKVSAQNGEELKIAMQTAQDFVTLYTNQI